MRDFIKTILFLLFLFGLIILSLVIPEIGWLVLIITVILCLYMTYETYFK